MTTDIKNQITNFINNLGKTEININRIMINNTSIVSNQSRHWVDFTVFDTDAKLDRIVNIRRADGTEGYFVSYILKEWRRKKNVPMSFYCFEETPIDWYGDVKKVNKPKKYIPKMMDFLNKTRNIIETQTNFNDTTNLKVKQTNSDDIAFKFDFINRFKIAFVFNIIGNELKNGDTFYDLKFKDDQVVKMTVAEYNKELKVNDFEVCY